MASLVNRPGVNSSDIALLSTITHTLTLDQSPVFLSVTSLSRLPRHPHIQTSYATNHPTRSGKECKSNLTIQLLLIDPSYTRHALIPNSPATIHPLSFTIDHTLTSPTTTMSLLRRSVVPVRALARFASSSSVPAPKLNPEDLAPVDAAPPQSPNVPTPWSKHQNPKPHAWDNPRFEQINVPLQPDGLSAMGLVHEQPVVKLHARTAVCNGGEWGVGGERMIQGVMRRRRVGNKTPDQR